MYILHNTRTLIVHMARYIGNCYLVFALRKQTYAFIVKLVTAYKKIKEALVYGLDFI